MNKYIDLKRVEFFITDLCTSRCIHCSNTRDVSSNRGLDFNKTKSILDRVIKEYNLDSVMVFGGEPLIFPEETVKILKYAREIGIPSRQLITNAYWSSKKKRIDEILRMLKEAEVNDILISVDHFHQEFLDFSVVEYVISQISEMDLPGVRIHPCWYDSADADNKYDNSTRSYLKKLEKYNIPVSGGNRLFPAGRAIESFPDLFKPLTSINQIDCGLLPYTERPDKIESIGINPEGLVSSLCFGEDMTLDEFLKNYNPYSNKVMKLFLEEGAQALKGDDFDVSQYYSICDACKGFREVVKSR